MSDINFNAILVRAFKTFVQSFAGSLLVASSTIVDLSTGKAVLIGAAAAGISGVMNLFVQPNEAK